MTREQLDCIPDDVLRPGRYGGDRLIAWLHTRGWRMTLLEVDQERRARGLTRDQRAPRRMETYP